MQPNKKSDMYIRGYSNAAISFDYIPDFSNKQEKMDFEEGLKDGYNKKRNFMDSTTIKDLQR